MTGELTNHLWQSTVFAIAAALLTVAFRKNRAQIRYWLWFSASLKFFIPFALLMALGSRLGWAPAAKKIATETVVITMEQIAQPFPMASSFVPSTPRPVDWTGIAIFAMWVFGFVVIALMRLRAWLRIRAAVRASAPLEIPAKVQIRSSPGLLEPGVVGLLRPILLVPAGIEERLTPPQLEAVLAHELCHVRRRDNLFASIHMVVEAMFWFHPLVWWIGARLVEERERACDEGVLSLGSEPRAYAEAILNVCKLYVESPLVCVSGVTGADLKRRVEAIMTNRIGQRLNRAKKLLLATAGVAALAGPVAIGVVIGVGHAPLISAQSPVALPEVVQTAQIAQAAPATARAKPVQNQESRLIAMLFDLGAMTSDEQSRARQSAIQYIHDRPNPADRIAVMTADNARVSVVEDFTSDRVLVETVILKLSATAGNGSGGDARLSTIEKATEMLASLAEKKMLVYFSSGSIQLGPDNQVQLQRTIDKAIKANVSIYPIDPNGTPPQLLAQSTPGATSTVPAPDLARPSYMLGVNDRIQVRASEVEELNKTIFLIDQDGTVNLPLLGRVKASGLPVQDLEAELVARLKTYVINPQVQITVVSFRIEPIPIAIGIMNAPPIPAQPAAANRPKFEVASIKPCKDEIGRKKGAGESSPDRLSTGCIELVDANYLGLIQRAYVRFAGGHANPLGILAIKGGPDWIHSQMYEIDAKAEGHPGAEMMQGPMLQTLLEDRFKLKIHRETTDGPVYVLTLGKSISKLTPFKEGSCVQIPLTYPVPTLAPNQRYCKVLISSLGAVDAEGSTLSEFSKLLNLVLDRPVIDKTGMHGRFGIHLEFSPDQATPKFMGRAPGGETAASNPTGPTIFTAIQEQLGLKLVPDKGPVEFLVIDHVERPSQN